MTAYPPQQRPWYAAQPAVPAQPSRTEESPIDRPATDGTQTEQPRLEQPRLVQPRLAQPRIAFNDYSGRAVPERGEGSPGSCVSVLVPAHGDQERLDLTLASLAAQSYPGHLTEVVVVDDGSDPPLRLPPIRPERTRL